MLVRTVRRVAAPELVAAVTAQHHLHVTRGEPREQVRRQERGVGERLVELAHGALDDVDEILLPERLLDVLGADAARDLARVRALVERRVVEGDRERLHPRRAVGAREGRDGGRVEAAAQEDADGDVRDELPVDGVVHPRPQLACELALLAARPRTRRAGLPECLLLGENAVFPDQEVPGAELSRALDDRVRSLHVVGEQVGDEPGLARSTRDRGMRHQRRELGREGDASAGELGVVERLDAGAIAREDEAAPRVVPEREREHSVQHGEAGLPVLLQVQEQSLGVALRAEDAATRLEVAPQLAKVVELAVVRDLRALRRHRLGARLEIDDREAAVSQRDEPVASLLERASLAVGAAMRDAREHRAERGVCRADRARRTTLDEPADPAHGSARAHAGGSNPARDAIV